MDVEVIHFIKNLGLFLFQWKYLLYWSTNERETNKEQSVKSKSMKV